MSAVLMDDEVLVEQVIDALKTVFDPEIPTNIYDLGLIYAIDRIGSTAVSIRMTLTAPGCPVAGTMPGMVQSAVEKVEGITHCEVELVWSPPWDKSRMSDEAMLELGLM